MSLIRLSTPKSRVATRWRAVRDRRSLPLFACLLLAACGGGGGGGGGNDPGTGNPPGGVANQAPVARFSLTPGTGGSAPLLVSVDAADTTDADGSVTSYSWDFGDGSTAQVGVVTQHVYATEGTFTVTLTATDNDGDLGRATATVTVSPSAGTATISGTISILPSSAIDSDVNDRLTTAVSNNDFDNAQPVTNPLTLGGFANLPSTGAATGNLFASGDRHDFYRIELSGQEEILLTIAEPDADLDLRLWDDSRALVDASLGMDTTEVLSVTEAGTYFIEVLAFSGASNYILNVGLGGSTTTSRRAVARLSDAFVPGELILTAPETRLRSSAGPAAKPRPQLVALQPAASGAAAQAMSDRISHGRRELDRHTDVVAGGRISAAQQARLETLRLAKLMNAEAGVSAEVNALRKALAVPNDPFYSRQWHYENINLPLAWDITTGSSDVIVAVIDSGVLLNHPDLNDRLVAGFDFISSPGRARDGDGIDPNPDDPGDLQFGGSSSFHGTHVAGTIGAESNTATPEGGAGVDWTARIMPLRALGLDGGTTFDVVQAMRFAAGLSNDSGTVPAETADIINLSLGSEFSSASEQATINEIRNLGILIAASAGNESTDLPSFPAAYDGVVSVAATTISNGQAPYSNFGSTIDVAAPGGNNGTDINGDGIGDGVISAIGDDGSPGPIVFGYAALNGTSMAAPHIAGVMALMKAVHPALTPAEFDAALAAGELTVDLGAPGRDDVFGFGLIDARRAVLAAIDLADGAGIDPGPILASSNSSLNFGSFGTQFDVTFSNIGSGELTIDTVSTDQPWLTATAQDVAADGTGTYRVSVDRSGLADGSYTGTVTADSSAGSVDVRVTMQVLSANTAADAGLHFVILVDSDGSTELPAAVVSARNGEYSFTLRDVPPGQYRVFGGTDSDDDNFLCDDGEACGSFRTLDAPETLTVNGDIDGVDFLSEYRLSIESLSNAASSGKTTSSRSAGIPFRRPEPSP
ncbi:MAG: S8 family serine peptidase [Pseudomonadota bacterium]